MFHKEVAEIYFSQRDVGKHICKLLTDNGYQICIRRDEDEILVLAPYDYRFGEVTDETK